MTGILVESEKATFLDVSKIFDAIFQNIILLEKLKELNFDENAVSIVEIYIKQSYASCMSVSQIGLNYIKVFH